MNPELIQYIIKLQILVVYFAENLIQIRVLKNI